MHGEKLKKFATYVFLPKNKFPVRLSQGITAVV